MQRNSEFSNRLEGTKRGWENREVQRCRGKFRQTFLRREPTNCFEY